MNTFMTAMVRGQLAQLAPWQTFEARRRAKTTQALRDLLAACGAPLPVDFESRIGHVLEAALPLDDLLDVIGSDGLTALATALQKRAGS